MYKCRYCESTLLVVIEEVVGDFSYDIRSDNTIDWDAKVFDGDSSLRVRCSNCHKVNEALQIEGDKIVQSKEFETSPEA
jgi:hypothetical protein